ncbi:MAG: hypothetical protein AUI14_12550 [Actinobacteria bacterium 13_2_20CM_2_71_6]|nr:MAG: hypothetical protein AUI14_12550 [Actinobacteria bacterium 13_2_20CM_2_71_6]
MRRGQREQTVSHRLLLSVALPCCGAEPRLLPGLLPGLDLDPARLCLLLRLATLTVRTPSLYVASTSFGSMSLGRSTRYSNSPSGRFCRRTTPVRSHCWNRPAMRSSSPRISNVTSCGLTLGSSTSTT